MVTKQIKTPNMSLRISTHGLESRGNVRGKWLS